MFKQTVDRLFDGCDSLKGLLELQLSLELLLCSLGQVVLIQIFLGQAQKLEQTEEKGLTTWPILQRKPSFSVSIWQHLHSSVSYNVQAYLQDCLVVRFFTRGQLCVGADVHLLAFRTCVCRKSQSV